MKQATSIAELPAIAITSVRRNMRRVDVPYNKIVAVFLFNVSTPMTLCPPENFILEIWQSLVKIDKSPN